MSLQLSNWGDTAGFHISEPGIQRVFSSFFLDIDSNPVLEPDGDLGADNAHVRAMLHDELISPLEHLVESTYLRIPLGHPLLVRRLGTVEVLGRTRVCLELIQVFCSPSGGHERSLDLLRHVG